MKKQIEIASKNRLNQQILDSMIASFKIEGIEILKEDGQAILEKIELRQRKYR
jgi:hypothetical protein